MTSSSSAPSVDAAPCTETVARTVAGVLTEQLRTQSSMSCAQISTRGCIGSVDIALGHDQRCNPIHLGTLIGAYCVAKPVLAVAALRLVAGGILDLDEPIGRHLAGSVTFPEWVAGASVRQLLDHSAGLDVADPVTARLLPPALRPKWMSELTPPADHRPGIRRVYSEFGGWWVLGALVEAVTGSRYDQWCRDAVLDPYGIHSEGLVLQPDRATVNLEGVAVSIDYTRGRPVPILSEAGAESATEWNPAYGALATAGALASLYVGILDDIAGRGRVLPADLAAEAVEGRPGSFDPTLTRVTSFGLGVMCDPLTAGFGAIAGPRTFGHYGAGGVRFALADPDRAWVIVVMGNGMVEWPKARAIRVAVSEACASSLAIAS